MKLHTMKSAQKRSKRKRVGRGPGSGVGKTSGRGIKGAGARSGYKRRLGTIGGGMPLHMRLPTRGFTRGTFQKKLDQINLGQIEQMYNDGETVSVDSLRQKNFIKGVCHGVKVLGEGSLTKKLKFEGVTFSRSAKEKLKI